MPSYAEPKYDWDTDDVLSDTDFNRIEGNIFVLARRFTASSVLPYDSIGRPGIIYQVSVSLANNTSLVLRRWRACITNGATTAILPIVQVSGEASYYTPSARVVDEPPDFTLASNTSGSTALKTLQVLAPSGDVNSWASGSAFTAILEIVDL